MAYVEEPISLIETYIGRRLPLAMAILALVGLLAYTGHDISASFIGGALMIVLKGYFEDVANEKVDIIETKRSK